MIQPWGGLGEERGCAPAQNYQVIEPWGGLGEERGSLPPSMH